MSPAPTPVLDLSRPYGEIFDGSGEGDLSQKPRYLQDGHYFRPDRSYHSANGAPVPRARPAPPKAPEFVNTLPGVTEAEVPALLADPRAEELLELPRDQLIGLVQAANGPTYAGEGSTQLMVAWLLKNTAPDGAPPAATKALLPDDEDL